MRGKSANRESGTSSAVSAGQQSVPQTSVLPSWNLFAKDKITTASGTTVVQQVGCYCYCYCCSGLACCQASGLVPTCFICLLLAQLAWTHVLRHVHGVSA